MPEMLDDPAKMTPQQRRQEIAAILARGVLRLRQAAQTSPGSRSSRTVENLSKQRQNGLDEGAETSSHVLARGSGDALLNLRTSGGSADTLLNVRAWPCAICPRRVAVGQIGFAWPNTRPVWRALETMAMREGNASREVLPAQRRQKGRRAAGRQPGPKRAPPRNHFDARANMDVEERSQRSSHEHQPFTDERGPSRPASSDSAARSPSMALVTIPPA